MHISDFSARSPRTSECAAVHVLRPARGELGTNRRRQSIELQRAAAQIERGDGTATLQLAGPSSPLGAHANGPCLLRR